MRTYSVDEAFELLKANKITKHKESVRRWLRSGTIKGIKPTSKKEGWKIPADALHTFMQSRLPEIQPTVPKAIENNTTTVVNDEMKKKIRAEMWAELANKNIWEGYIVIKKALVSKCIQHKKYSKSLENEVWKRCKRHADESNKVKIPYLLEACQFENQMLLLDQDFQELNKQILFAIIEHVKTTTTVNIKEHWEIIYTEEDGGLNRRVYDDINVVSELEMSLRRRNLDYKTTYYN